MGSREAGNAAAAEWLAGEGAGRPARAGTFAEAAASAEIVVNATSGHASLAALEMAGAAYLAGKPLIDVANPLDFSHGMPPTLTVAVTDSLGEQIQRAFPEAHVVKTLNTVNSGRDGPPRYARRGPHDVRGGRRPRGQGDRGRPAPVLRLALRLRPRRDHRGPGMEAYLLLWLNMRMAQDTNAFNIKVVRG
jgi:hypothetical protein